MNVLFCNFDEEWHNQVIGEAACRIGAKQVISISVRDLKLNSYVESYHWIDSRDINQKIYTFMKDKELPSLDADMLGSLTWCESLYYPMLDRMEVEGLKNISYHERRRYYENDLRCMLWILQTYKIDLCVFSTIPHISFDYALYGLCKYLNIKVVIGYFGITIPHKNASTYYLSDIFDPMPQLKDFIPTGKKSDEIQLPARMQCYYDQYGRDKSDIKSFVYFSDYAKPQKSKLQILFELVKKKIAQHDFVTSVRKKVVQYFFGKRINRYLDRYSVDHAEGKYIYYPLHYQPECTSLPMGGFYYDQIHVVRLISQCLPEGVTLYVKPHPRTNLLTGIDFYEQIRTLPNVKLLASKANTYTLIDNALAVVSLTGTAITESLIRGTPVMMFGYYFWQYCPNVFHCVSIEDCRKAVEKLCNAYSFDEGALKEFLCEFDKGLVDGTLYSVLFDVFSISMDENIKNVTDAMVDYINKVIKSDSK